MIKEKKINVIGLIAFLILGLGLLAYLYFRADYKTQLIKDIKQNPATYQQVIELIKATDFAYDYEKLIKGDRLPKALLDKLSETKIKNDFNYLTISKLADCDNIKVEFMIGKLHLEYYSCPDSSFPKPDIRSQIGFIETIGINKNWCIWIDHDFI